jgi:long-chain acyl-CoA synthetase
MSMKMTITDAVENQAKIRPDHAAYIFEDKKTTFKEYNEDIRRVANSFLDIGLRPGDRICTILRPSPAFLTVYMAAALIGIVVIPMDQRHTKVEMENLCKRTQPKILVCDAGQELLRNVSESLIKEITFQHVYTYRGEFQTDTSAKYESLLQSSPARIPEKFHPSPEDPLITIFTSGTTGRPKGALISHKNTLTHARVTTETWGITHQDRAFMYLPTSHVGGTHNQITVSIYSGQTNVIMESFNPNLFFEFMEKYAITRFGGLPTIFRLMLREGNISRYDLSSVRQLVISGEPASPELIRRVQDFFPNAKMVSSWGMSETCGYFTLTKPGDDFQTVIETEGTPGKGYQMIAVKEDGQPAPAGEIGELWVKGDSVITAYMDPEDNQNSFQDGWMKTGDLGYLDERNYLHFVGRSKEMFKSGGYNVYPQEVEAYLNAYPGVNASCVIGIPDEIWGEVGVAFFVPEKGVDLDIEGIQKYCKEGLASYKRPKKIIVEKELPRNAVGKIAKQELRKHLHRFISG